LKELSSRDLARLAGQLALSKKGFDVKILRLNEVSSVCDYFVIVSGDVDVQVKAIARAIDDGLRDAGYKSYHREGLNVGRWVLLDYIDVVVHVFQESTRKFYALEKLWGDAPIEELADDDESDK